MHQMMQGMPEQCRAMAQNMPQGCMAMMQQMMQRHGSSGGTPATQGVVPGPAASGHAGQGAPAGSASAATQAYKDAAEKMHAPMMAALQANDPDEAFVRSMIPHHQGAIDMALVVLQHGKDEQAKKWALDVIREQAREIGEMQAWLARKSK